MFCCCSEICIWYETYFNWCVRFFSSAPSYPQRPRHFAATLINLTDLLPQSHDRSCYVRRPMPEPPPLSLHKHTDLLVRAHEFAHSPDVWHEHGLSNFTCAWNWRLCGIHPAIKRSIQGLTWFCMEGVCYFVIFLTKLTLFYRFQNFIQIGLMCSHLM